MVLIRRRYNFSPQKNKSWSLEWIPLPLIKWVPHFFSFGLFIMSNLLSISTQPRSSKLGLPLRATEPNLSLAPGPKHSLRFQIGPRPACIEIPSAGPSLVPNSKIEKNYVSPVGTKGLGRVLI